MTVLAAAAALAGACGSSSTNLVGPTAQKCQISVSNFTGTFGPAGGNGTATIDAARECSWSAASQAGWIAVASGQGSGAGTLAFTVAANQAAHARSGALVVNGEQLTVSQAPAPCSFKVVASAEQFGPAGGSGSASVSTLDGCAWTASSGAPWLHVSAAGGSGNGGVSFSVDPNDGVDRAASLIVAGQTLTISQSAAAPPPGPPPAPGCQFAVSPASLSFPAAGGQATLRLTTASGCAWTATGDLWLALSPQSGSKADTIAVNASPNVATTPRSGTIVVGGQSIPVDQAAAAAAPVPVQLSGNVSARRGTCPTLSFIVQQTGVVTDANTSFVNAPCDKVKNGTTVTVDGVQQPGQPVLATRVAVTGR